MELKDTIELMCSPDHKERLVAETLQAVIRTEKLEKIIELAKENKLTFDLTCSLPILEMQLDIMQEYEQILLTRCNLEGCVDHLLSKVETNLIEKLSALI